MKKASANRVQRNYVPENARDVPRIDLKMLVAPGAIPVS
jgi:hypothetical protein